MKHLRGRFARETHKDKEEGVQMRMKSTIKLVVSLMVICGLMGILGVAQPSPLGIIIEPSDLQVKIWVDKAAYQVGENIRVHFSVNQRAYIYIVDIDAAGVVRLIFPNRFSQDNLVGPTADYVLPDKPSYRFVVMPPVGTEFVQIFASTEPLNLDLAGFAEAFPKLGSNPEEARGRLQAAIQGIIPVGGKVATDFTSFQVVSGWPPPPTNRPPVASFTYNPINPLVGQTVFFDASRSYDPDGYITRYDWDFNSDGFVDARGITVTYTFFAAGPQRVTLTVIDNGGLSNSTMQIVQVGWPGPNRPPVASFTFSPVNPLVGQTIFFDASGSYDPDGYITNYQWDFTGDGFPDASGVRTTYSFFASGSYLVTLTVTDNMGATASTSQWINVGFVPPPPPPPPPGPGLPGFFIDAVDANKLRIRVQGQSTWFYDHEFRMVLETDGTFTFVDQQVSGPAAPLGIVPVPVGNRLELSGKVRSGSITYIIGVSRDATKIKFDLRLDIDGDGVMERRTDFVYLGPDLKHPPSNPFVLSFPAGTLLPFIQLQVCLVLVDVPGFKFIICFNLGSL